MFAKSFSTLALLMHASTLASAGITVQIGYYAGLVPGLPGPEPGIGCGLWAQANGNGDSKVATYGGGYPSDSCPAADKALFCGRWGCPKDMTFGDVLSLTVNADHGDQSIEVTATALNGPSKTVTCPWAIETITKNSSGALYQTWKCDLGDL